MSDMNNVSQRSEANQDTKTETARVVFTLARDLDRAVEIEAAKRNITKSQLVNDALVAFLPTE